MAKKKRSTKRSTKKKRRGRPRALSKVDTSALREELERRAEVLPELEARRRELEAELAEVDAQISALEGSGPRAGARGRRRRAKVARKTAGRGKAASRGKTGRPRGRPRGSGRGPNNMSLELALAKLLKNKTMSVTEATERVQTDVGYTTTSPNFRTIVNQTLIKSDMFKKVARGQYTAK
jgi:hypothetical protein